MANQARVVGGVAVDVTPADQVQLRFHGDVAAQFVDVPDTVQNGWLRSVNGQWSAPPAPPPAPPPAVPTTTRIGPIVFFQRFTPFERVAIRASKDPIVQDFMTLLNDPRTLEVFLDDPQVQQGVGYLAGLSNPPLTPALLDPARIPAILAPAPLDP